MSDPFNLTSRLPANTTDIQRSAVEVILEECALLKVSTLKSLFDPKAIPTHLLDHLAYALSVDYWDEVWSEERKRNFLLGQFKNHSIKGSPKSIIDAIADLGYESKIVERYSLTKYDGSYNYDGSIQYHKGFADWVGFSLELGSAVTIEVAKSIKNLAEQMKPARSRLIELIYPKVAHAFNGKIRFDGQYTFGVVNFQKV